MKRSFGDYLKAVDEATIEFFGLDLSFAPVNTSLIEDAWREGWTPEQFAVWNGKDRGFKTREDFRTCTCFVCQSGA